MTNNVQLSEHIIYILDKAIFKQLNINFLNFIRHNLAVIRNTGVKLNVMIMLEEDLMTERGKKFIQMYEVKYFPILITPSKIYQGINDIVTVYNENIKRYHKFLSDKELIEQKKQEEYEKKLLYQKELQKREILEKEKQKILLNNINIKKQQSIVQPRVMSEYDEQERLHEFLRHQIDETNNDRYREDDDMFEERGNSSDMVDSYKIMMDKRNSSTHRNLRNSNLRTIEREPVSARHQQRNQQQKILYQDLEDNDDMSQKMQTMLNKQQKNRYVQNTSIINNEDELREDNIKAEVEDESVDIDPTKINIEKDENYDPLDDRLERAYWARIAETKKK